MWFEICFGWLRSNIGDSRLLNRGFINTKPHRPCLEIGIDIDKQLVDIEIEIEIDLIVGRSHEVYGVGDPTP